jgi:DNA-binding MarR family transcriptional regulator
MADSVLSPQADALTRLILTMFRVNNLTVAWGDRIVAPLELTSARWQILGAIVDAERCQPVAWLARDLGANRQNVQRIVNDLEHEGLVEFQPNPHHKRAQLVAMTKRGRQIYEAAVKRYTPAANALAEGFSQKEIETAKRVLTALRTKLEGETESVED